MTNLRIVIPAPHHWWSMIPTCAGTSLFRKPVSTLAFARACFSGSCSSAPSAHHQARVLALAFGQAPRPHPVVGALEQRRIIVVDVLVAHEGAREFARLQSALGVRRDVVS